MPNEQQDHARPQRSPGWREQLEVGHFVTDPHRPAIRKVQHQTMTDLLRRTNPSSKLLHHRVQFGTIASFEALGRFPAQTPPGCTAMSAITAQCRR